MPPRPKPQLYGPTVEYDTSTNEPVAPFEKAVKFVCPRCGQYTVIRTQKSRKLGITYKCPICGFEGP